VDAQPNRYTVKSDGRVGENRVKNIITNMVKACCGRLGLPKPEGKVGLFLEGHRNSVGGKWDEIGRLQFEFMLQQGLKSYHVLLDIGCGSLRGGIHFIAYLEKGNYLGIDKNRSWVDAGIKKELTRQLFEEKRPEFVISDTFEVRKFSKIPDYALAQSLFTHLSQEDINLCLSQLRKVVNAGCVLYATFFECSVARHGSGRSHSHRCFQYTQAQMHAFGKHNGWQGAYIGDWNHPRGQKMMAYTAA
jgi:hypothetical protein